MSDTSTQRPAHAEQADALLAVVADWYARHYPQITPAGVSVLDQEPAAGTGQAAAHSTGQEAA